MFSVSSDFVNAAPVSSRSHKKSRNGCKACKLRKVKCDERKPVCRKCTIHYFNIKCCEYGSTPAEKPEASGKTPKKKPVVSVTRKTIANHSEASFDRPSNVQPPNSHTSSFTTNRKDIAPLNAPQSLSQMAGAHSSITSDSVLKAGQIDPFSILPVADTAPNVHILVHYWIHTLSLFPTEIHSQYCTNPTWLTTAIESPTLFNLTLLVSSLHLSSLHGNIQNPDTLFYKNETIRMLNRALADGNIETAVSDEMLSAVLLLTHIVSIISTPAELQTHTTGLKQMISLRGGIKNIMIQGVFLHMLCTTNHLTAVLSESPILCFFPQEASGSLTTSSTTSPYRSSSPTSISSHTSTNSSTRQPTLGISTSLSTITSLFSRKKDDLLKPFAISCGFHVQMVELLSELDLLLEIVDSFTTMLLPVYRQGFEALVAVMEQMATAEEERKEVWRKRKEERSSDWNL